MKAFLSIGLIVFSLGVSHAQDITGNVFGKGLRVMAADSSIALKFGVRFSTLYEGFYNANTKEYADNISTRRFRLKFDGFVVSPKLVYKLELGISNRDIGGVSPETNGASRIILDAVLKWNFAGNFNLWFGQTKLPGNRQRVISSQKLQFVDRSLLNSRFNLDRDIGIQLHHHHKLGGSMVVREAVSLSKGEGRNITIKNKKGYDFTGRLEFLPMGLFTKKGDYFESDLLREHSPKLALGASYDYNAGAVRSNGQNGFWLDEPRDLEMIIMDAIFKYKGFSSLVEYANRTAKGGAVVKEDANGNVEQAFYTGKSINAQAAYLFKNFYEVGLRYTTINQDPTTQRGDIDQYTLGFSKYIVGHNLKAQTDFTLIQQVGQDDIYMFRFQVEMAF
ncbi:MAG: FmdC precursor [Bacteroidetes bacterium]|nr:MAG: FmdC precursor [Bacteroidota bacterium]